MSLFKPRKELTYDMLNQRQLMALKFKKHKLAVAASFLLVALYGRSEEHTSELQSPS